MASAAESVVEPSPPRGLHAAWGIHLGLLLVAASALISRQSPPLTTRQLGALALVGLALLVWAALEGRRIRLAPGLRLLIALGAVLLWSLARAPQAQMWVGESGRTRDLLEYLQVSLGTVGVAVVLLSWLVYYLAGGEREHRTAPLRRGVVSAGVIVILLAAVMYVALFSMYGREGDLGTILVSFQALQFMALASAVLGATGGPLVRRAPAWYLGLALLGVVALTLWTARGGGL